jgi:hypothetical protein
MAFELHRHGHQQGLKAASAINPRTPVKLAGSNALFVLPAASGNDRPFGVTGNATAGASGLNSNDAAVVYERGNVVKAVAAASVGVGAAVFVASTNGALGPNPITASAHWEVGISETPAAAGEIFSVYVDPRKA